MVNWYKENYDFFALTTGSENNVEELEFESGKKRYFLKNSTPRKTHSFSFLIRSSEEEALFWAWYEGTLLSRTNTVELPDLVTYQGMKEYRLTEEPTINNSQYPKECSVSVIEE